LAVPRYPIEFYLYTDGLFVRRASRGLAGAVGGRVVQFGGLTAEQALNAVEPLCSVDGPMGIRAEAPRLLSRPDVLETLRLVKGVDHVPLIVQRRDGTRVTIELTPARLGKDAAEWVSINASVPTAPPLYLRGRETPYWFEHLSEARLVYMQYN